MLIYIKASKKDSVRTKSQDLCLSLTEEFISLLSQENLANSKFFNRLNLYKKETC